MAARIFILLFTVIAPPCSALSFEYFNLFNNNVFTIQTEPAHVAAGDRASIAAICTPVDAFVCVESEWFNFAIPVHGLKQQRQWTFDGHIYNILAIEKVRILGNEYNALRIQSVQGEKKFTYIYSYEYGLLGFEARFNGEFANFISARAIGFGAKP